MLSPHLVRQIEQRADKLSVEIVDEVLHDPHTPSFKRLSREELLENSHEFFQHLGDWLAGRTEAEVERTFGPRGRDRFLEGIPIDEVVYSLILVKRLLRRHTKQVSGLSSAAEIHSEMEVDAMVGSFFDRVLYAFVRGWEQARHDGEHPRRQPTSTALGEMKPGNIGWIP
jgi:hypothetical protein